MAEAALKQFDLKNLQPREIALLVVAVLGVLGFGYYTFEFKARQKAIKEVKAQLIEAEGNVAAIRQAIISPERINAIEGEIKKNAEEISGVRAEIAAVKSKMQEKYVDILQQLKDEAVDNGAVMQSFKTSEKPVERGSLSYKEVSVTMKIQVEYDSLINLVARLETIPALLSLESLEVLRKDEILPKVESRLSIRLYVL